MKTPMTSSDPIFEKWTAELEQPVKPPKKRARTFAEMQAFEIGRADRAANDGRNKFAGTALESAWQEGFDGDPET